MTIMQALQTDNDMIIPYKTRWLYWDSKGGWWIVKERKFKAHKVRVIATTTNEELAVEILLGEVEAIGLPCLYCGEVRQFNIDSNEAKGIFNVFCSDKDCEDKYAISL